MKILIMIHESYTKRRSKDEDNRLVIATIPVHLCIVVVDAELSSGL